MTSVTITFAADWHVGTGAGLPGDLDAVVRRDEDGLPVVPARTVTGIWRDGCERVAAALGGEWPTWVEVVCGRGPVRTPGPSRSRPREAALSVRTAKLGEGLRSRLLAEPWLMRTLTGQRPGVKIDVVTGQAAPTALRMVEVTRSGLVLRAPFEVDDAGWDDQQRRTAAVLLTLGAEQVRALGGDRRRGLGECRWSVPVAAPVRVVLDAPDPPVAATPPERARHLPAAAEVSAASQRVVIDLSARCVDPVVSTVVATDAIVRGQASVPGGRVLPGVVARCRAAGVEVEHLVARGELVCGPLVPEVDGQQGRVAPLVLVAPKGASSPLYNRLRATVPEGTTPKPLRDRWIAGPPDAPAVVAAATRIRPHNAVEDAVQRPTSEVGGLYTYESIPAGSLLRGRVELVATPEDATRVAAALSGTWRVGLARKDEYGRVEVKARVVTEQPSPPPADRESITIWFVTDAVFLDGRLAPVTTVEGVLDALGEALGTPVAPVDPEAGRLSRALAFGRVDGWQTRWVRPRPTLPTVAAGSVIAVRRRDGLRFRAADLARIAAGIGERRAEGYGQISVDDPLLAVDVVTPVVPEEAAGPAPAAMTGAEDELLTELRHSYRRQLIEEAAAAAPREGWAGVAKVYAAQRAGLRAALTALDLDRAVAQLAAALGRSERAAEPATARARTQLERLLTTDEVWTLLKIPPEHRAAELKPWAVRRLLAHLAAGGAVGEVSDGA